MKLGDRLAIQDNPERRVLTGFRYSINSRPCPSCFQSHGIHHHPFHHLVGAHQSTGRVRILRREATRFCRNPSPKTGRIGALGFGRRLNRRNRCPTGQSSNPFAFGTFVGTNPLRRLGVFGAVRFGSLFAIRQSGRLSSKGPSAHQAVQNGTV